LNRDGLCKMSINHFEIMYNILLFSRGKKSKTNIHYYTILSFNQLKEYFRLLLEKNLLHLKEVDGHKIYETTEKGVNFLESFKEIQEYLSNQDEMLLLKQN